MPVHPESLPASSHELVQLLRATLASQPPASVSDWQSLLQQATLHGVDAFLYPTLIRLPAKQQPPPEVLAIWRQQFLSATAATVRREEQTRELLSALAEAQVRAVPLKGTWLAAHVYPEPGQRQMCDIDLLVPPQDLARTQTVLKNLGYTPHGFTASIELDYDQPYTCPRHDWPLELHWTLGATDHPPLRQPDITGLQQRLVPETLLGVPIRALCLEEHLVLLAFHALHHSFLLPLRGYLDIVLLTRQLSGDDACRASLQTIAAEWGLTHALPRVMSIAHDLLGQAPPPAFAGWMPDDEQAQREQAIRAILLSNDLRAPSGERTFLAFQKRSPLARANLLWQRIFMPREFLRREYSCARWWLGIPLAYILRMGDLMRRHAHTVRLSLQHDPAMAHQLDLVAAREQLLQWALTDKGQRLKRTSTLEQFK